MKNIYSLNLKTFKVSKFTSLLLAGSIMLGTVTIPNSINCDFKSDALNLFGKATNTFGRFLFSKNGIKAIAASLFIAQNMIEFHNENKAQDEGNLPEQNKSMTKKFMEKSPLYLEHAGSIIKSSSDPIALSLSLVNAAGNIVLKSKKANTGYFWEKAFDKCCEKISFLKTIREKLTNIKKSIFENERVKSFTKKIQDYSKKTSWKFFTSKYGVKTLAQLTAITCAGLAFYNQENNTKSGITKTLPFYLNNTLGIIPNLVGKKIYETTANITKIALGENLTKKANSLLPRFVEDYAPLLPKISY